MAGQQPIDLPLINIKPHRAEAGGHERADQRQADVTQPYNADHGRLVLNSLQELRMHYSLTSANVVR